MSKVNKLILELCPNGVEYAPITEVADFVRGLTYAKDKESPTGSIKVLRSNNINQSQNVLNLSGVKTLDSSVKVKEHQKLWKDDILMSAASGSRLHVGKVAYIWKDMDFYFGGFMAVWRTNEKLMPRFLFHILTSSNFSSYLDNAISSSTINNLSESVLRPYLVPVPPLKIQQEIVQILDKFTQLEAELEAELEARKSQYEYYRESLFEGDTSELKPLESVASIWRGRRFVKDDILTEGVPAVHYGEIYTKYGLAATEAYSFLDPILAAKLRFASPGDVVLVSAGETIEDIGKSFTWLGNQDVVIHDACYGIRSEVVDPRYMVHFFNTHNFRSQLRKYISSSKISAISTEKLGKVFIPVPSLKNQREVADVLDAFDALIMNISSGIPGEIRERRQQYEYYRNKLLTFKELEAV